MSLRRPKLSTIKGSSAPRRIRYGSVVEQGMWRIRTNQEVRELYKDLNKVADIKTEKIGMDWTCIKSGLGEGQLRKYLRVNRREVEDGEDLV
jgi:hypothetical protein